MEKMHDGVRGTSGFSWQRVRDDSQAVEASVSRCHEVLQGDVMLKKQDQDNLANIAATQTTQLLLCALAQMKYIFIYFFFRMLLKLD